MNEWTDKNFGVVIAYLLPGFVALWGVSYFSPTVASWISVSQQGAPTVAGVCYVTLASLAAGLIASAVRWVIVDSMHHATGLVAPAWSFGNLEDKLQGFLLLVESHYRYYQFYSNMFVAVAFAAVACLVEGGGTAKAIGWPGVGFLALELVLFAGSRDTLRKYYSRTRQLLNTH
jgi:hypothetical protein